MNIALLKYMNSRVRLASDLTHQEYLVAGINWDKDWLLLLSDGNSFWCDYKLVNIIPEDNDDY